MNSMIRKAGSVLLAALFLQWFLPKLFHFPGQSLSHNIMTFFMSMESTAILKTTNFTDPQLISFLNTKRGTFEPFFVCRWLPVVPQQLCDTFNMEMETIEVRLPSRDPGRQIPATCFIPPHPQSQDSKLPLVAFFHGGGLIFGSIAMYAPLAKLLALRTGSAVCAVGYRLAPQYPYPAASDDAFDATLALLGSTKGTGDGETEGLKALEAKVDASKSVVFGISAGGHLAVMTSLRLAEASKKVSLVVAVQPMIIPFAGTASMIELSDAPFVSQQMMNFVWYMYLQDKQWTEKDTWTVNPLKATDKIISRLSPTVVAACKMDVLHTEGVMYAEKLEAAGKLRRLIEPETSHVGILLYGSKADSFWDNIVTEIKLGLEA